MGVGNYIKILFRVFSRQPPAQIENAFADRVLPDMIDKIAAGLATRGSAVARRTHIDVFPANAPDEWWVHPKIIFGGIDVSDQPGLRLDFDNIQALIAADVPALLPGNITLLEVDTSRYVG